MDTSKFLSKVIGIYLLVVSLAMILNMQQFMSSINHLINNAPIMFVTGFITLILGILMVVGHNIWQWNWRLIITIFAWLVLLKGASIILYPKFIDKTTILFMLNLDFAYVLVGFEFILGLLLCYFGFRKAK